MNEDLLLTHFEKYPEMQLEDCVKLLHQNAYGPGHMLKDPRKALQFLRSELANAPENGELPYMSIGNGLCRLDLPACRSRGIAPEAIFDLMIAAAKKTAADPIRLAKGLETLRQMTQDGSLPYDMGQTELFLLNYRDLGYPALHHSAHYADMYRPAYRVVIQAHAKQLLRGKSSSFGT